MDSNWLKTSPEVGAFMDKVAEDKAMLAHKERRERIAIAAMQGIRVNQETLKYLANTDLPGEITDLVSLLAVQQADALIAELDKVK